MWAEKEQLHTDNKFKKLLKCQTDSLKTKDFIIFIFTFSTYVCLLFVSLFVYWLDAGCVSALPTSPPGMEFTVSPF
jgi:hypothetical protein